jgi:hypothetical protein
MVTPINILVVGITDNLTARKLFEEQLKTRLNERVLKLLKAKMYLSQHLQV